MCVEFLSESDLSDLDNHLFIDLPPVAEDPTQTRTFPGGFAPVISNYNGSLSFRRMKFGLVPSWSSTQNIKFGNHNTRIETAFEKPAWSDSIKSYRCIIPIKAYFEPISVGANYGTVVKISSESNKTLLLAGIFSLWRDELLSFSIVTEEPDAFTSALSHDRQPIALLAKDALKWIAPGELLKETLPSYLSPDRERPLLISSFDRYLKGGRQLNLL